MILRGYIVLVKWLESSAVLKRSITKESITSGYLPIHHKHNQWRFQSVCTCRRFPAKLFSVTKIDTIIHIFIKDETVDLQIAKSVLGLVAQKTLVQGNEPDVINRKYKLRRSGIFRSTLSSTKYFSVGADLGNMPWGLIGRKKIYRT